MNLHLDQPLFSVHRFAADLAARYGVSQAPIKCGRLVQVAAGSSGAEVPRDVTRDTLLALRRANIIDAEMHAHLLLTHLRELRAAA